jgi:hypothetical protein
MCWGKIQGPVILPISMLITFYKSLSKKNTICYMPETKKHFKTGKKEQKVKIKKKLYI